MMRVINFSEERGVHNALNSAVKVGEVVDNEMLAKKRVYLYWD
jgi:hypothetical protein